MTVPFAAAVSTIGAMVSTPPDGAAGVAMPMAVTLPCALTFSTGSAPPVITSLAFHSIVRRYAGVNISSPVSS